jgi:ParB-like chromosome segregation protein Spo0J
MLSSQAKIYCKYHELLDINLVTPNPLNVNIHPPKQLKTLARVIEANGIRQPIVISKLSNLVVKGHARLEALKLLGVKLVPVEYQEYSDNEEEMRDLIEDNSIAKESVFNEDLFKNWDADLELFGIYGNMKVLAPIKPKIDKTLCPKCGEKL